MKQVKTKYSLWWVVTTVFFAAIIWLIIHFMPSDGWVYWTDIIAIILLVVAYLCLTVVLVTLYVVDAYQDEIKSGFREFGHSMIDAYNDYHETMWRNLYAYLGKLFKSFIWFFR